jgi:hypothetical protein
MLALMPVFFFDVQRSTGSASPGRTSARPTLGPFDIRPSEALEPRNQRI